LSRDFRPVFRALPALMRAELPAELRDFQWQATSWMAKAWYGNKLLHYEIWVRDRARVVELGLHFESDALTNARLFGAFRARAKQIARALGADARIEEWDKGWSRVWQPYAIADVDDGYATMIKARFVQYVRALEPILREELPNDVEWKTTRSPAAARSTRARGSSSRASRSAR
jgi:hypothetical protein